MATQRKPAALVAAEKRIVELEKQLASEKSSKDMWYKDAQEQKSIVEGIHDVLDDLGIRGYKDDNKYQRVPITVRLFSWAMQMAEKANKPS